MQESDLRANREERTAMDEDVKLQLTQAHEKWMARTIVFGVCFVVAAFFGTCVSNHLSADSVEKARIEHGAGSPK